ncbi:MAG: hypothetical protein ACREH6_09570, partial [Geminicoccaceae bacterium]
MSEVRREDKGTALPIDRPVDLDPYMGELELQTEFALRCLKEVQERTDAGTNDSFTLALAHAALVFAGHVSKLFFPARGKTRSRQRGELLRQELGVTEKCALANRRLRNHLEHFDEQLDNYVMTDRAVGFCPFFITPGMPGQVRTDDGREFEVHFLRGLDTSRLALVFLGEEVELRSLVADLTRVHEA